MKFILPFPPSVNTYWRSPNKGPAKVNTLSAQPAVNSNMQYGQRSLSNCVQYQNHLPRQQL